MTNKIVSFDYVNVGKYFASSVLRCLSGMLIYLNKHGNMPLFRVGKKEFSEHVCENESASSFADFDLSCFNHCNTERLIFMHSASLVLRNPDHLWSDSPNSPIIIYLNDLNERLTVSKFSALLTDKELESHGHRFVSSPGIFSVHGDKLEHLTKAWKQAQELGKDLDESIREKAVWNKTLVMLAGEMTQKPFERGEVIPVREGEIDWDEVRNACIVSVSDWKDEKAKEHFLRCLYFGHFFGDESGLMLNILDP
jgi:hypothetical protein